MEIQEIANRLVELSRKGEFTQAVEELFAENATAHEMPGVPMPSPQSKQEIIAHQQHWDTNIESVNALEVTDPLIYGNQFTVGMGIDVTRKDGSSPGMEREMCIYQVADGKIQSQHFIYKMPQ